MPTVEITLLYCDAAPPALDTLGCELIPHLRDLDIVPCSDRPATARHLDLIGPLWRVTLCASARPFDATQVHGSMNSLLSQTVIAELGDILTKRNSSVSIAVEPLGQPTTPATWLAALRLAHLVASAVSTAHRPAAIHWPPSNQLLTGQQYAAMSNDPTPWPLLTHVEQTPAARRGHISLRIDNAADFVGRPILFPETDLSSDVACAAALAFLRHAVESGAPIPDGHDFGPEDGYLVRVTHATATAALPHGSFVLRSSRNRERGKPALPLPGSYAVTDQQVLDQSRERTRSLAISFLMLVLLPPVGLVLMFSNAFLRPSSGRTGLVSMATLAILLVIGAHTFLNIKGEKTAALTRPAPIETQRLTD